MVVVVGSPAHIDGRARQGARLSCRQVVYASMLTIMVLVGGVQMQEDYFSTYGDTALFKSKKVGAVE